jgi:hypothetical protein
VSERFVRKVSRLTLDWSVQAQSVIDRELRHRQKAVRRLRKTDPGLAEELRAALADGVVETDDWPQRSARWFALVLEAGAAGLRNPGYLDEVARLVDRGIDRVEALAPPAAVAAEHAALVRAQRGYAAAVRELGGAAAGEDVEAFAAAAERVQRSRTAIDAAFDRLAGAGTRGG